MDQLPISFHSLSHPLSKEIESLTKEMVILGRMKVQIQAQSCTDLMDVVDMEKLDLLQVEYHQSGMIHLMLEQIMVRFIL